MYSFPGETSTGTMYPGNLVANATSPATPLARYSVIKIDPPPATRLITPNKPPPPANCVCVVISMELPIHESSPASEMTDSLGSRTNSNTGIVVPVIRLCMFGSYARLLRCERRDCENPNSLPRCRNSTATGERCKSFPFDLNSFQRFWISWIDGAPTNEGEIAPIIVSAGLCDTSAANDTPLPITHLLTSNPKNFRLADVAASSSLACFSKALSIFATACS